MEHIMGRRHSAATRMRARLWNTAANHNSAAAHSRYMRADAYADMLIMSAVGADDATWRYNLYAFACGFRDLVRMIRIEEEAVHG